jgi:hypothetical protein
VTSYAEFLARKQRAVQPAGCAVDEADIHPMLHPWQKRVTAWAVRTGRCALWADTGTGKTVMQLEYARLSGNRALVIAPLAVCRQTVREAAKLGIDAQYVRRDADADGPGVWVTNYEMALKFDPAGLDAVVLDEASILKQSDGKTRTALIGHFRDVKHRLACTATPAPNDNEELTSQAEFVGVMPRAEMLAAYFVHDDEGWRVKGHARGPMFRWMATWAVALRRPSDIGGDDTGYILPGYEVIPHLLPVDAAPEGQLFATELGGVGGRAKIRKATLEARCGEAVRVVNESHELAEISDKLAAWDGPRKTTPSAVPGTSQTPSTGNGAKPREGHLTTTGSTCASTAETTGTSGAGHQSSETGSTVAAVSGTPQTRSSAPSASASPSSATRNPSAITGSASSSGSPPRNTTSPLSCKADAAPSAGTPSQTGGDTGCTSTMITGQDVSGGSSAVTATSDSGSSRTTRSFSAGPSATSSAGRPEPWIVWCGRNDEQEYLERAFGSRCFSVTGTDTPEVKADRMLRWVAGERPILLTKPSIAGFGMNFQHCARMVFVGLSDSYEAYYQCIRRCHRYGQSRRVRVHVILSELEGQIAENVARKERHAAEMTEELVREMRAAGELRMS